MALDSTHPSYSDRKPDWVKMRDFYQGARHVKSKGTEYLPATKGMQLDGMGSSGSGKKQLGQEVYDAYRARAVFPDYVKEAVENYVGILHQKPPTIELPDALEPLRDKASLHGESLELLLRRINEEQLVTGRLGLLADLPLRPDPSNPLPYIALYIPEAIRNWDDGEINEGPAQLDLVVLDETSFKRQVDFEWTVCAKYRVLQLDQPTADPETGEVPKGAKATYTQGVFVNEGGTVPTYNPTDVKPPKIRGQTLDEIPFVFINTKDLVPNPDEPPLLGLGEDCLTIYRGEADFRQNLFMQGQDTLVIIGNRKKTGEDPDPSDEPMRTGAGSVIELEPEAGADVKYAGVESQGLEQQRQTLESDRKRAETKAGQLNDTRGGDKESGEALKIRVGAQSASLHQIAKTGAAGLEQILKICAKWIGANPDEVKVTPNLEFADINLTGKDMVDMMTARTMGFPLSKESMHGLAVDRGLTQFTFDEELEKIGEEDANDPNLGRRMGGNPDDVLNNQMDQQDQSQQNRNQDRQDRLKKERQDRQDALRAGARKPA